MSFQPKDFDDNVASAVNVPLATIAALVFGLKAVFDMRDKIGTDKIKGIFISSDHTVVETAMDGQISQPYLQPLVELLTDYKQLILDDENFPNCMNFAHTKIQAATNKAAKAAKEARQSALDDDVIACSFGDIDLWRAVTDAVAISYGKKAQREAITGRPVDS